MEEWWRLPRWSDEYEQGVDTYIENAFATKSQGDQIRCPCKLCHYRYWHYHNVVKDHMICKGFVTRSDEELGNRLERESRVVEYNEQINMHDDLQELLHDTLRERPNEEAKKFLKIVEEGQEELYPKSKTFSKLSFVIRLFIYKCDHKLSNVAFGGLLELLRELLPDAKLPSSFHEANEMLKVLGLDYKQIDAHKTDDSRWTKRPKTISDVQSHQLGNYSNHPVIQEESERNKASRQCLQDMHTMGPRSFTTLRHNLQQEDLEKKEPSKAKLYKDSRKKDPHKTYKTDFGKTKSNIEQMEALDSLQYEEGSNSKDPYDEVIKKPERNGRLRLSGKGVTQSDPKKKGSKTSYIIPEVFLKSARMQVVERLREANPGINIVIPEFDDGSTRSKERI